jgi:WD40 repeat protein
MQPLSVCPILELSEELCVQIFSYLEPEDLYSISHVCQQWHIYIQNDWIWKSAFHRHFQGEPMKRLDKKSWRQEYCKRMIRQRAFKRGNYRNHVFNPKIGDVAVMVSDEGDKFIIGSEETGMIAVCNPSNGNINSERLHCSATHVAERVLCLTIKPKVYVCGHDPGHMTTIEQQSEDVHIVKRFLGRHRDMISSMDTNGSLLVSGDCNGMMTVSGLKEDTWWYTLRAHSSAIVLLHISDDNDSMVISGCINGDMCVWKLNEEQGCLLRTWRGHRDAITQIQMNSAQSRALTSSRDGTLKVWSLEDDVCRSTLEGHLAAVDCFSWEPEHGWIVSGSQDGTIKVWKSHDDGRGDMYEVVRTLRGRDGDGIVNVQHDACNIAASSVDGYVTIWDIVSGECLKSLKCGSQDILSSSRTTIQPNRMMTTENLGDHQRRWPCILSDFRLIVAIGPRIQYWDFTPIKTTAIISHKLKPKFKDSVHRKKHHHRHIMVDMREELQETQWAWENDRHTEETWRRLSRKNNIDGLTEEELVQYATMLSLEEEKSSWGSVDASIGEDVL